MTDFREPLPGFNVRDLSPHLVDALHELRGRFPGLGIVLLVCTYGEQGALAHISSIDPRDLIPLLREHARHTEAKLETKGELPVTHLAPPSNTLVLRCLPHVRQLLEAVGRGRPLPSSVEVLLPQVTKALLAEMLAGGRDLGKS